MEINHLYFNFNKSEAIARMVGFLRDNFTFEKSEPIFYKVFSKVR